MSEGFSLQQLVGIFSARSGKAALPNTKRGSSSIFTASQLKEAGYGVAELRQVGFSWAQLTQADCDPAELRAAGATAKELALAGVGKAQLEAAGYPAADLEGLPSASPRGGKTPASAAKRQWLSPSKRLQGGHVV